MNRTNKEYIDRLLKKSTCIDLNDYIKAYKNLILGLKEFIMSKNKRYYKNRLEKNKIKDIIYKLTVINKNDN